MARPDPAALRWLIGVEVGNYRGEAGFTLAELSALAGVTRPKLAHLEAGRAAPNSAELLKILTVCGAPETARDALVTLAESEERKTWWAPWARVVPEWFRTFVGLEGFATKEFTFEPLVIPGMLQTLEYATVVAKKFRLERPDRAERAAAFRMERSRRLTDHDRLALHAIITEAALRMAIDDEFVRQRQIEHLIQLSAHENVSIQVIRPDDGVHAALQGGFTLLSFAHARPVAYVEYFDGATYRTEPEQITGLTLAADDLKATALSKEESRAFLKDLKDLVPTQLS